MKTFFAYIILVGILNITSIIRLTGQEMTVWEPNVYSITDAIPVITDELMELSDPSVYTHPEFGILPEDAPCDNCIELIDHRTLNSRYYVQNGTNGNFIYSQTALGDLHYTDDLGRLISFDRRLKMVTDEFYAAEHQATPTMLNLQANQTGFKINGDEFIFNNHLQLKHYLPGGEVELLGNMNWENRTVGDHGIYITDAWPNIDVKITFDLNMIKTNFIVKAPLGIETGYIAISDQLILPDNYDVEYDVGENGLIGWEGSLMVASTGEPDYGFEIGRAFAYDNKTILSRDSIGIHHYNPEYKYDSATQNLSILVPLSWLNDADLIYPVTIDPLVTSTATYGTVLSFRYNGEWCGGVNYCSGILDVALPPNCTLTAATFSSQYITTVGTCAFACWMSDAGFRMWSDSCDEYSPLEPFFWSCAFAGIGTCTAVNYDLFDLVSCITPKCSGSVPIQIRTSYCYCNANGTTCPTASPYPCQRMNASSWSVTLSGHNLETLGDAIDGNGEATYNDTFCCDDFILDPEPEYGVPPYTYLWSDATTGPTITVSECTNGTYVYTCEVTDACNVTRTATFTLVVDDCLLPITLTSFECDGSENEIQLDWTTETETNCESFYILRSANGVNFTEIGRLPGHGTTTSPHDYTFTDDQPLYGVNYYMLRQVDFFGEGESYSPVLSCMSFPGTTEIKYFNLMGVPVEIEFVPAGIYIMQTTIGNKITREIIYK